MTKATGVGGGRKKVPWPNDPDRFHLAYMWIMSAPSRTGRNPRLSERAAANNLAVLEGEDLSTDQVKALRKPGSLDFVMMRARLTDNQAEALHRSGHREYVRDFLGFDDINSRADTLRKKFNRLKKDVDSPANQALADYFGALGAALVATFSAPDYGTAFDTACLYADLAGERSWFLERLAPCIRARFGRA